jgi:solute carrier family 25 carnitine/acylcarnitine transporter 20/29
MPTAADNRIAIPAPPELAQDVTLGSASKSSPTATTSPSQSNYRGFVAGVFSGIAKLAVGHPFDTIKVRLQTAPRSQFRGPLECLTQTLRREGFSGLYKGATPPLVGWMFMDSL